VIVDSQIVPGGSPVRVEALAGGAVWRLILSRPTANILDHAMMDALTAEFVRAGGDGGVKAIVLEGEGPNFSFGVSIQEHLPDRCEAMLRAFHGLLRAMLAASIPTLAAVRGQCLGGGLELAGFCGRVIASRDARLGQPEITLGVFAPVASIVLAARMGQGGAEDLLLSGRSIDSEEALRRGLVDEVADDPAAAALEYARTYLVPRSASSLRFAVRAARLELSQRLLAGLEHLEALYLRELMRTEDAIEGLNAFLEKRPPRWKNR
jgi:cyclohexa-1,5-dienecarbonyl-CoA hydratase